MKGLIFILFTVMAIGVISCDKEISPNSELTKESKKYLPLAIDKYWIYSVDSIKYNRVLGQVIIDTIKATYKETITDTFRNNENQLVYRLKKEKLNENQSWTITDIYKITSQSERYIRNEENIDLVELSFPIFSGKTWNALPFIDKNVQEVTINGQAMLLFNHWNESAVVKVTKGEILGQNTDIAEILDVDEDDEILFKQYSQRKYAKNIGLIEKTQQFYSTQYCFEPNVNCETLTWEQKIDVGFSISQKLIETN